VVCWRLRFPDYPGDKKPAVSQSGANPPAAGSADAKWSPPRGKRNFAPAPIFLFGLLTPRPREAPGDDSSWKPRVRDERESAKRDGGYSGSRRGLQGEVLLFFGPALLGYEDSAQLGYEDSAQFNSR
jgi:hypothetical protein